MLRSEAVLHTGFDAKAEVVGHVLVSGEEGDFAIHVHLLGDVDSKTSFSADFGLVLFAIYCHDSRTSLDVVTSAFAKVTFVADVEVGHGTVEVVTSVANVGFNVHIRTGKSRCGHEGGSCGDE